MRPGTQVDLGLVVDDELILIDRLASAASTLSCVKSSTFICGVNTQW